MVPVKSFASVRKQYRRYDATMVRLPNFLLQGASSKKARYIVANNLPRYKSESFVSDPIWVGIVPLRKFNPIDNNIVHGRAGDMTKMVRRTKITSSKLHHQNSQERQSTGE
jgi:hypothetical protein